MNTLPVTTARPDTSYPEYEAAFVDLERRAARGEFTLAQWRHEVHALRRRYTGGRPVSVWQRRSTLAA